MDRISICEDLAKRNESHPFLKRMVTGDEKWVTYYNIVQKRLWSKCGEAAQTVAKPGLTARKVLLCICEEFHFQLYPDNHQRCVWRRLGQGADPAFTIARHTSPQSEVMVWGAISFDSRTPLGVIRGTLKAQRYVDDILRTVLLPLLSQYPGLIFSKILPDHIRHVCVLL
ncbi:transposable element Tc1 transposase [Trichonephila clavipes]|nr:transposable element Tc1 transposase [Trichonephila clavipes]